MKTVFLKEAKSLVLISSGGGSGGCVRGDGTVNPVPTLLKQRQSFYLLLEP